ncbi:MAG: lytic murein transglycosylase B [Gammaproteobacteria bacterium]|nr:lytic murein transglycosylase B [Gammaproteobacteria bacterium]
MSDYALKKIPQLNLYLQQKQSLKPGKPRPGKHFLLLSGLSLALLFPLAAIADVSKRKDVGRFIDQMVEKHQFDRTKLIQVFSKVKTNASIIKAITRPAESKPWHQYRPIFLTESRINEGVEFWNKYATELQRAYEKYDVPPHIVVAIIGVESKYGRHKGRYSVMNALTTLGFDYPKRSKFFKRELEEFLLLAREEKVDPMSIKGSYAGAMGKPQFIASSYRAYAQDFDGDGKRDLLDSTVDTIGSVANYFKRHKWYKDEPIVSLATIKGNQYKAVVKKGIKPHISLKKLMEKGVTINGQYTPEQKTALIELETKSGKEHWVAFNNFYVITRYNHSQLYAMAVYQLSEAIIKRRAQAASKKAASN